MSDENGKVGSNGHRLGGLASLLPKDEVAIPMNSGSGEYSGVTFFFDPLDARTDQQYVQVLQRGGYKGKSTSDEAIRYVFSHKFGRVVFEEPALNADDELSAFGCSTEQISLFHSDPKRFFLTVPDMWRLVRNSTNKYLNEVSPEAGDSKSGG